MLGSPGLRAWGNKTNRRHLSTMEGAAGMTIGGACYMTSSACVALQHGSAYGVATLS